MALGIEPQFLSATEGVNPDEIEIDPFQSADRMEKEVQELEASLLPIVQQREQLNTEDK